MQNAKLKLVIFILGIGLTLSLTGNILLIQKNKSASPTDSVNFSLVKPVSAKEIYPLFECPCGCGQSLQCTCGHVKERKNYVDALLEIGKGKSKDEIILAYVKKYGLDSFMDKKKQKEFREKLAAEAPSDRPIISINPESYNFGDVSQKAGIVNYSFEIKNKGESDLIIDKLETSCGCTSASIVYQGKEGPKFSMPGHGVNEKIKGWQVSIPPGGTAKLKVYYDPNFHKDFRGPAIREITVFSNDPIDFQKTVQIELNQVN